MSWLVIIIVLAAAFGPIAYLLPSKSDRALAELRRLARAKGLEVAVTRVPKLAAAAHERVSAGGVPRQPTLDCVSYALRLPATPDKPCQWRVLRTRETSYEIAPGWELDRTFSRDSTPLPGAYWQILHEITPRLPADAVALAVTESASLCYWLESVKAVDAASQVAALRTELVKLNEHHLAWDAQNC